MLKIDSVVDCIGLRRLARKCRCFCTVIYLYVESCHFLHVPYTLISVKCIYVWQKVKEKREKYKCNSHEMHQASTFCYAGIYVLWGYNSIKDMDNMLTFIFIFLSSLLKQQWEWLGLLISINFRAYKQNMLDIAYKH